jgi:hypothetical protein
MLFFIWPINTAFMKQEAPAKHSSRLSITLRLVGASFLCLLNLAIVFPNLKTYSNHQFVYPPGTVAYVAFFFAPLVLVLIGMRWCRLIEEIGWALLIVLLAVLFIG